MGSALQVIDETAKEPNHPPSTRGSGVAIDYDHKHLSPTGLSESPGSDPAECQPLNQFKIETRRF